MSDFNLDDALAGQANASGQQTQTQGQNWNNQWGGQPYPGGYQAPGQGQPGFPPGGQPYPGGFPAGGQPYPGGFPPGSQQYPGGFPGYPGFPAPGQQFPGGPVPGQPTDPKAPGQPGASPSAPFPSAPAGPLKLPHALPLQAGIVPGLVLTIQGVINPNAKRWCVDFKMGDDIPFHCNPRFDENPNVTVRNAMFGGRWGAEERGAPKFPFAKGQPFMMKISVNQEQFQVSVNNETLCQFRHRSQNFQQIKTVIISGDITLNGATVGMM